MLSTSASTSPSTFGANAGSTAPDASTCASVYIGGTFTEVSGHSRAGLAAFDIATGALDSTFSPSTNGNVYGLLTDGVRLFVTGHFTEIGRSFNNAVASWTRSRARPARRSGCSSTRRLRDGARRPPPVRRRRVLQGQRAAAPRARLGRHRHRRGRRLRPRPGDHVYALTVTGGQLVAGGRFTSAPRTRAPHLAAINAATGETVPGFAGATDGTVAALAVTGGRLFAGGDFTAANGARRRALAAISTTTGVLDRLDVPVRGDVYALAAAGDRLYVGGAFSRVAGVRHPSLAAIDLRSGKVSAARPRVFASRSRRSPGG